MYYFILLLSVSLSLFFIKRLVNKGSFLLSFWFLYLFIELLFGIISKEFLANRIGWKSEFSIDFLLIYLISILTIYICYNFFKRHKSQVCISANNFKININVINRIIIILLIPFLLITIKIFAINRITTTLDNRTSIIEHMSGFEFVLYKLGFIVLALIAYKAQSIKFIDWVIFIIIIFSFGLYSGRFLIFSGLIIFFIIYFHNRVNYARFFRVKFFLPVVLLYITCSIFISNTRYYMSNNYSFKETLTIECYTHTAFMQLGGNWLDFSRVSEAEKNINLGKHFFPTITEGFLPQSIRNYFFQDFYNDKIAYGKYFAQTINEDENALRMNFTNEIYFSFGYIGVMVYSLFLGFIFVFFDKKFWSSQFPLPLFFLIQLLSLHILGINTFSNSIILTLLFLLIVNTNKITNLSNQNLKINN